MRGERFRPVTGEAARAFPKNPDRLKIRPRDEP